VTNHAWGFNPVSGSQIKTIIYAKTGFASGMVLRRDKYPVHKPWQGKAGFIRQPTGCEGRMGYSREWGEGKMPGTAAGCFAEIRVMTVRTFPGRISCSGTVLRICRKHFARLSEA
jgi:hypothetical protein